MMGMTYICRAEQKVRMKAHAIRADKKNECPIEGHTFLPNREARNRLIHQFGCKQFQSGKTESAKTFSEVF